VNPSSFRGSSSQRREFGCRHLEIPITAQTKAIRATSYKQEADISLAERGALMRYWAAALACLALITGSASAHGLLVPADKSVPPLAMLDHQVRIAIEDQAAVTRVEQSFRNHTDRPLEATYLFPVPRGASVRKFTMWVDGREVPGEMVEADKARQIYTDIVRRALDPGLLEYVGNDLLRVRVFPVPARGDVKMALSYTALLPREGSIVEYDYPLKAGGATLRTLAKFSIDATLKSQHAIQSIYSPTHAISVTRSGDKEATVHFERDQGPLDKTFQLFYSVGDHDVGMTLLTQRPDSGDKGTFMLLISPREELSRNTTVPRDMVLVLDTSGSMRGAKIDQAKRALKYCLSNLGSKDRFGLMNFATTVNKFADGLVDNSREQVERALHWVGELEASGGTAIQDALNAALDMRTSDASRTFTIVFFTDGQPTVGETSPESILKNVAARNTANTRIFTFGVGDDVNATMLDQLAEQSRAVSTYVRPAEDIEVKTSSLYTKISRPVLTGLKLSAGSKAGFTEIYPPQLPDLFHGSQLILLGRYSGQGPTTLTLTGMVGNEKKEFTYEINLADKTNDDRSFVEQLWARRKVGYLLDQIRGNGEKKELVDEVVSLAKKYGITTPYTSYLIVPDSPIPMARGAGMGARGGSGFGAASYARNVANLPGGVQAVRERLIFTEADESPAAEPALRKGMAEAKKQKEAFDRARELLGRHDKDGVQTGKLGVDLSLATNDLKNQTQLRRTAQQQAAGQTCLEIDGVWIDDKFDAKMPSLTIKAMSDAYFRLLERQPQLREVFQLGNEIVWVTPSGTALVIEEKKGQDQLANAEIDRLFTVKK
jgi:Ca-activated chloride channel family protein